MASALHGLGFLTCIKVFFCQPRGGGACGHQRVTRLPSGELPTWDGR